MGLRFRKSISLFPGVRLNFGKTGTLMIDTVELKSSYGSQFPTVKIEKAIRSLIYNLLFFTVFRGKILISPYPWQILCRC